ncbi:Methyltranfer-dom domain-containing protein [Favolaschia claudopus]|uniref:Methyltranfer-dom domain-containing protein n=1 Tax=Favolaschia claudopus TaxID=2862362 RepID=A0AAW0DDF5_9AGAR
MPRLTLWPIPLTLLILGTLYLLARQHDILPSSSSPWLSSPPNQQHHPPPPPHHPPPPSGHHTNDDVYVPPPPLPLPDSRLNLTLAGNELRYQAAVRERRELIEKFGGKGAVAFPDPYAASYTLWDLYQPVFSCPWPVYRVGTMGDGGKWVCGLHRATHHTPHTKRPCVVYSMGVEKQSSFEQEVLHQGEGCEVFGFDFSVREWGPELRADTAVNSRAHFFPYKIGATDRHDVTPKEYSLQGIMKELGHEFIDIWKIDIEGSEFNALRAVLESFKGKPLPFGQMQIEIHLNFGPSYIKTIGQFDDWWTMLEDAGLRAFWTELNLLDVNVIRRGPFVGEWSFINIRGRHPLIDDSLPEY